MRTVTRLAVTVCIIVAGLSQQCTTRRGTDSDKTGPEGTYLDDPLLLSFSSFVLPTEVSEGQFVFDLSQDSLIQSGRCNDIFLRYVTGTTCDEDVEVWSVNEERWYHVAHAPPESVLSICFQSPWQQRHLFSAFGVDVESVLDDSLRLRLRTVEKVSGLAVRALEVNPEYWTIPASEEAPYGYWCLTYGDGRFITTTFAGTKNVLIELDNTGRILRTLSPAVEPIGITWDGEYLWLIGVPDTLYQVDWDGNVVCRFAAPSISTGELTWDGASIWLSEWPSTSPWIWALDPVASCASGRAVVVDSFPRPGGHSAPGLAWDGKHLLVTSQNHFLYRMTRDGTVVDSCRLPVPANAAGATWDGNRICLLADGLNGINTAEPIIACFRVR